MESGRNEVVLLHDQHNQLKEGGNPFHLNVSYFTQELLSSVLGVDWIIGGDHNLIKRISKDLEVGINDISIGNQSVASALLTASNN